MQTAITQSLGSSLTGVPLQEWVLKRLKGGGFRRKGRPSRLGCTLLVPLDFSYAIRGTGDTDGYVLDLAATLEKRLDLLAEAFVGSLRRSGVCLVHAGYSVMSH